MYAGLARFAAANRRLHRPGAGAKCASADRSPAAISRRKVRASRAGGSGRTARRALEWLFWAGLISVKTRRGFERIYDVTERAIPAEVLALPTPSEADAQRELVRRSAEAMGVATIADLTDYFRIHYQADAKLRARELVEAGVLEEVSVPGWRGPAFLYRDAKLPRRAAGAALLSPFDNMIWSRERTERVFGIRYRIGLYTPAAQREHGYYVYPFLLGERLAAQVDLKADRAGGRAPGAGRPPGAGRRRSEVRRRWRRSCAAPRSGRALRTSGSEKGRPCGRPFQGVRLNLAARFARRSRRPLERRDEGRRPS